MRWFACSRSDAGSVIAIVGGGISGLAAAFELSQRGVAFVLFDRAPRPGGVIRTEQIDGYTIDAGPDALLTQKPAALALCRALGIDAELQPQLTRDTFVVRGGRLRRLPYASPEEHTSCRCNVAQFLKKRAREHHGTR